MSSGYGSVLSSLIKGDPTLKAEDFTETYIFGGHAWEGVHIDSGCTVRGNDHPGPNIHVTSRYKGYLQSECLELQRARLIVIPSIVFSCQRLMRLDLSYNSLAVIPTAITNLRDLCALDLSYNSLRSMPVYLQQLPRLTKIDAGNNLFCRLPWQLLAFEGRRAARITYSLTPLRRNIKLSSFAVLSTLLATTIDVQVFAERIAEICVAMQELDLPALVLLKIVKLALPANSVRRWARWEVITAVKHFHQRHTPSL